MVVKFRDTENSLWLEIYLTKKKFIHAINKNDNDAVFFNGPLPFKVNTLISLPLNFSIFDKYKLNIFGKKAATFKKPLKYFFLQS